MSVSFYTGHVGSGKTYEVVRNVICPAIAAGRVVVTNIDGLDPEKVAAFCRAKLGGSPGSLLVVARDAVRDPAFFPSRLPDGGFEPSAFVPLGALVVVDEAGAIWPPTGRIPPAHGDFLREHRHIVGADGVACDLVIVSQTVDSVHRSVRGLVEFSVDCRQLKSLGSSRRYTIATYDGSRRYRSNRMAVSTHSYDPAVFALYRSFAAGNGRVVATDARRSVWSRWQFWVVVGVAPFVAFWGVWHVFGSLRSGFGYGRAAIAPPAASAVPVGGAASPGSGPASPGGRSLPGSPRAAAGPPSAGSAARLAPLTSPWVLVGSVSYGGQAFAVLSLRGFPVRLLPLGDCVLSFGEPIECKEGRIVYAPRSPRIRRPGASVGLPARPAGVLGVAR